MKMRSFLPLLASLLLLSSCVQKPQTPEEPEDTRISPSAITLNYTELELAPSSVQQLLVTYEPENAEINKDLIWRSTDYTVASVNQQGRVTVKETADIGDTAEIFVRLRNIPSVYATCTITVVSRPVADFTLLIYMSGGILENYFANKTEVNWSAEQPNRPWDGCGFATKSIQSILGVSGKPDDVNIVIETGGSHSWANKTFGNYGNYDIQGAKNQRHHVNSSGKLEFDETVVFSSMGDRYTLQLFLEYGFIHYPAQKTALVLWGEGGGIVGVCADQEYSYKFEEYDVLSAKEIAYATKDALYNTGKEGEKLEFIAYDCGLMNVQDNLIFNAPYYKYMVGEQEAEKSWAYGWDYSTWIDDLYAKKSTPEILKALCDGVIEKNNYDDLGQYVPENNNQSVAYFDLSKANAYKAAFDTMAQTTWQELGTPTAVSKNLIHNTMKSLKHFGGDTYFYFGMFDAKDFINKIDDSQSYKQPLLNAFNDLVVYHIKGAAAGNANGLSLFWAICAVTVYDVQYANNETSAFPYWTNMNRDFGGYGDDY